MTVYGTCNECLSLDEEIGELVNGELGELFRVGDGIEDLLLVRGIEVGCDVVLELGHEERSALRAAALVADGVLDLNLVEDGAVVEFNEKGIADGALLGVVVVDAEILILHTIDLGAERVDAGVGGRRIGAVEMLVQEQECWRKKGTY